MDEIKYKEYYNVVYRLIGAAFDVHNELHYGLSEAIYEEALCIELNVRGIKTENQVHVPVYYKGNLLDKRYRLDLVIEDNIIVELKQLKN